MWPQSGKTGQNSVEKMASYGSERSFLFLLIFSAKDDPVKVSWKSDARRCQNQVTHPYFDQLGESRQPLFSRIQTFRQVLLAQYLPPCLRIKPLPHDHQKNAPWLIDSMSIGRGSIPLPWGQHMAILKSLAPDNQTVRGAEKCKQSWTLVTPT